jgi:hypothetical protein
MLIMLRWSSGSRCCTQVTSNVRHHINHYLLRRVAFLAIAAALAGSVAIYEFAKHPPTLHAPLAISEPTAFADGGSGYIEIEDEVGANVLVGLKGSLDKPKSQFPLVFQRWHGLIPFGRQVDPGSEDEAIIRLS